MRCVNHSRNAFGTAPGHASRPALESQTIPRARVPSATGKQGGKPANIITTTRVDRQAAWYGEQRRGGAGRVQAWRVSSFSPGQIARGKDGQSRRQGNTPWLGRERPGSLCAPVAAATEKTGEHAHPLERTTTKDEGDIGIGPVHDTPQARKRPGGFSNVMTETTARSAEKTLARNPTIGRAARRRRRRRRRQPKG